MSGFPVGALVLVSGRDPARVRAHFPKGSTSYAFPHYRLDIVDGDKNVAVAVDRVGVVPVGVVPAAVAFTRGDR